MPLNQTRFVINYDGKVARFSDEADAREFALHQSCPVYAQGLRTKRGIEVVMTTMRGGLLGRWGNGGEL